MWITRKKLCRQVHNLRQKDVLFVSIQYFFKISLISGIKELEYRCVAIYVNGQKYANEDDMSTNYFDTMDDAYQKSLKVKERLKRNTKQKFTRKCP